MKLSASSEMSLMLQDREGRSGSVMGPSRTEVEMHSRTVMSGWPGLWLQVYSRQASPSRQVWLCPGSAGSKWWQSWSGDSRDPQE